LGQYAALLGIRCFPAMESWEGDMADALLKKIVALSPVPVVNLESADEHPCQALADMMTIKETLGGFTGRKLLVTWAYHPKALPHAVPRSALRAASRLGMEVTLAHPEEFPMEGALVRECQEQAALSGGSFQVTHDRVGAYDGQEIVYAKSWASLPYYGDWKKEQEMREQYRAWQVTEETMERTAEARFMHCLPVRRNVVVSDGVLDGPASIVTQQAANRQYGQMAVLSTLIKSRKTAKPHWKDPSWPGGVWV
jgi:N-acetylornithine carbamoyltransferase